MSSQAAHRGNVGKMDGIADLESLRAHFGEMTTIAAHKTMPRLDRHSRAFIALSPFLVLATTDGEGGLDASPRGDPPGFVAMPDDNTLIIPDRLGRLDHRSVLPLRKSADPLKALGPIASCRARRLSLPRADRRGPDRRDER